MRRDPFWKKRPEAVQQISSKESVPTRRVIVGILPYVNITRLNRDADSATNVCSDTLRLMGSPVKGRRQVAERTCCFTEGVFSFGLCVPSLPSEVDSAGNWKIGIESRSQIIQGHVAPRRQFGKRKGSIAKELCKSVNISSTRNRSMGNTGTLFE